MTSSKKLISIILPSFNDPRIVEAIMSVRRFDDIGTVRLVVIDGGSKQDVVDVITPLLDPDDIFVSERDFGIFDALNKGLDRSDTEYIGWIGCDDRFTAVVLASEVVARLQCYDLFVANLAFFRGDRIRRVTYSLPSRLGLVKYGFHNPHYATFGRARLLRSERFSLNILGSDIDYFHRIFNRNPRVATTNAFATLQCEGGASNSSYYKILRINLGLLPTYAKHTNVVIAPLLLLVKIFYKTTMLFYYKLSPTYCSSLECRPRLATLKCNR